jgi:ABC-type transporter Mla subunit MlaD
MLHLSLLGEMAIDFAEGDPDSGVATDGTSFLGERTPDFSETLRRALDTLKPVTAEAEQALRELKQTAANLKRITSEGSDLESAIDDFRRLGDNLVEITDYGSPLRNSIDDFGRMTGNLNKIADDLARNERIKLTLENFQSTAEKFRESGDTLTRTINQLGPEILQTTKNAREMTDTLKRQPWRLIWPATKKYPDDRPRPTPTPAPRRR